MVPSRCAGASYGVGNLRVRTSLRQSSRSPRARSMRRRHASRGASHRDRRLRSSPWIVVPVSSRASRSPFVTHRSPLLGGSIVREIRRYGKCAIHPSSERTREGTTTRASERRRRRRGTILKEIFLASSRGRASSRTHHILRSAPARAWTARRPREAVARIALGAIFAVVCCANIFCPSREVERVRLFSTRGAVRRGVSTRARERWLANAIDRSIDRSIDPSRTRPSARGDR